MLNRLHEALEAKKNGTIENWVHDFLNQDGNNQGFSEGLKLCKRYWLGPVLMDLRKIKRCCGPEPEMAYYEPEENFNRRIDGIMKAIENGKEMPPLIVKYEKGAYELNDGNHRHEALLRLNQPYYYVILWDSDNDLENSHGHYKWINERYGEVCVDVFDQGHMKKCYMFTKEHQKYLVSVSEKSHELFENKWLLEHLKNSDIPVKSVYQQGTYGLKNIEVTSFIEGCCRENNHEEKVEVMKKLHEVSCKKTYGYGFLDKQGNGIYETAEAFIEDFLWCETKGYWKDFHQLFQLGLDRNLYEKCYKSILENLSYSEPFRSLVHGDFHYKHILFENNRVTGILDWDKVMYFDKLYDWLYLENPEVVSPYMHEPHYEKRLLNMRLIYLLDAMRFYFKNHYMDAYEHARNQLKHFLMS